MESFGLLNLLKNILAAENADPENETVSHTETAEPQKTQPQNTKNAYIDFIVKQNEMSNRIKK